MGCADTHVRILIEAATRPDAAEGVRAPTVDNLTASSE